jgi:alpha-N-arabinofuranosidase
MTAFDDKLPTLDAIATLSDGGSRLYLAVVNRDATSEMPATIHLRGWQATAGHVLELNGKDKNAANPFGSTANVSIREATLRFSGDSLSYTFPAHSASILELSGERRGQ